MSAFERVLSNTGETQRFGRAVAPLLRGGDIIALTGELGVGKTTLAKAIGQALGVTDMASPSFGIVHEHGIEAGRFMHMDAWRLSGEEDLEALGWNEWSGAQDVIVCVEWADRISDSLVGRASLSIRLQHAVGGRLAIVQSAEAGRFAALASSGATP